MELENERLELLFNVGVVGFLSGACSTIGCVLGSSKILGLGSGMV